MRILPLQPSPPPRRCLDIIIGSCKSRETGLTYDGIGTEANDALFGSLLKDAPEKSEIYMVYYGILLHQKYSDSRYQYKLSSCPLTNTSSILLEVENMPPVQTNSDVNM